MKGKKFFYRQLCEREQILICKSPSCAVCCDQAVRFGPEEGGHRLIAPPDPPRRPIGFVTPQDKSKKAQA